MTDNVRHPGEGRGLMPPGARLPGEMPAFAGMTIFD